MYAVGIRESSWRIMPPQASIFGERALLTKECVEGLSGAIGPSSCASLV